VHTLGHGKFSRVYHVSGNHLRSCEDHRKLGGIASVALFATPYILGALTKELNTLDLAGRVSSLPLFQSN